MIEAPTWDLQHVVTCRRRTSECRDSARAADPEGVAADEAANAHAAAQRRADEAFYDATEGNGNAYRDALEAAKLAKERAEAARAVADAADAARAGRAARVTPRRMDAGQTVRVPDRSRATSAEC
jgi:hypothetical protein